MEELGSIEGKGEIAPLSFTWPRETVNSSPILKLISLPMEKASLR